MDDDPDEITDPVEDDSNSNSAFDGWGDPLDDQGAVGGAWPLGVGWGPGGAPGSGWIQPQVPVAPAAGPKGDGDSGCGTDSEEEMEEEHRMIDDGNDVMFAQHISEAEYEKQKTDYTRQALDALIQSPEYQKKYKSCRSCWSLWLEGQSREDCIECGGYALVRPCPICSGKCGNVWKRNIDMSHSHNDAHWDGECGLPPDQRAAYMLQVLTDPDEEAILDGMMDLNTGSWSS